MDTVTWFIAYLWKEIFQRNSCNFVYLRTGVRSAASRYGRVVLPPYNKTTVLKNISPLLRYLYLCRFPVFQQRTICTAIFLRKLK